MRLVSVTWVGGNASEVSVVLSYQGVSQIIASAPITGDEASLTFEIVRGGLLLVDTALVVCSDVEIESNTMYFTGQYISRELAIDAGTHTYEVSLVPTAMEETLPVIGALGSIAVLGLMATTIPKMLKGD